MAAPVLLSDYDPRWPALFEQERARIVEALAPYVLAVEHFGSTAVPGLAAKPTVDLMVGIFRLSDAPRCIPRMQALGYEYLPELEATLPERRFFRRGPKGAGTHHAHMVEVGSAFWERHLLFRDHLRAHADVRDAYAQLKRELAGRHGEDREAYTDAKTPFIEAAVKKARAERAKAAEVSSPKAEGAAPPRA